MFKAGQEKPSSWAKVDKILLGRTVHIQSVSPFFLPKNDEKDQQYDHLTSSQLNRMAEQLKRFLSVRLTNSIKVSGEGQFLGDSRISTSASGKFRRLQDGFINHIQASFIEFDGGDDDDDDENSGIDRTTDFTPTPWAIEIDIQPSTSQSDSKDRKVHLLFFSHDKAINSTHYPLLLWKAPPEAIMNEIAQAQQEQESQYGLQTRNEAAVMRAEEEIPLSDSAVLTSRMLIGHVLEFITRYFDCRILQNPPMCSIRGENLAEMAEEIFRTDEEVSAGVEVGYAVPTNISNSKELNLISLTVPLPIVKSLMQGTNSEILPSVQKYLANHTSLQLHRLALVRIGIENVFIGAPTLATATSRSSRNNGEITRSNGEVRLKIGKAASMNVLRITIVLRHLIKIARKDEW